MIKAEELRIGNWILPEHNLDGDFHLVTQIGEGSVNGYIQDWYSPIRLTPEILEKCGFYTDENKTSWLLKKETPFYIKENETMNFAVEDFRNKYFLSKKYFGAIVEVKFLHQLQNLYFDLTGEELEIKLNVETNGR